jgi:hypothetical protein
MAYIQHALHQLFLDHDCIVVPGLGGFVCNRRPARYDALRKELLPPAREVQFNERLMHNDGVLAHALAVSSGCTYADALESIEKEASIMRLAIASGQTISLTHVGRLYRGANGATHFLAEPELERMLRSFGLQRIALVPLERVAAAPEGLSAAEVPAPVGGRVIGIGKGARWAAAASILPLLAAGAWWWTSQPRSDATTFSLPNWPRAVRVADYVPLTPSASDALLPAWEPASIGAVKDALGAPSEPFDSVVCMDLETGARDESGFRIRLQTAVESVASTAAPSADIPADPATDVNPPCIGGFLLVSGAFSSEANAQRHAAHLQASGTSVECILQPGGLYLVCIGVYQASADAQSALQALQAAGPTAAWIKSL